MKINRISESMGLISDELSKRAIEAFEKTSEKQSSISEEKPRVIREEKSRKAPFVIALAGICAAAAVAVPLVLKNAGKSNITAPESLVGAADSAHESILNTVSQSTPEEEPWSLPEGESIAVKVKDVKITLTDDKQLSVRDDENPNVRIFKICIDVSKANTHAFVLNKDGSYKTFAGNDISKEEILKECPEGVFGEMWSRESVTGLFDNEDSIWAFNGSHDCTDGIIRTYDFGFALDNEALRIYEKFAPEGYGGGIRIKDNGNGTYSIITAPYIS